MKKVINESNELIINDSDSEGPIFKPKRLRHSLNVSGMISETFVSRAVMIILPIICYFIAIFLRYNVYGLDGGPEVDYTNKWNFIVFTICILVAYPKSRKIDARSYYYEFMAKLPHDLEVHAYWGIREIPRFVPWPIFNWRSMQVLRAKRIWDQFPTRDDFKIEKSKCYMYRYMQDAGIPHGEILGYFDDSDSFWKWMDKQEKFPVVVKFCHLTQGSQQCPEKSCPAETMGNTFFLSKKEKATSDSFRKWVEYRWTLLAEDPGRSWENYIKEPLHSVEPGLFVQGAFSIFETVPKPFEMKISVIWGKAYLGRFETGPGGGSDWERSKVYFQRSYEIVNDFPWPYHTKKEITDFDPIPHFKCAEELAEKNARTLKMDYMRVDVFMNPDDPTKCAINEHSIFEPYAGHNDYYMMHAWAQPYIQGRVRLASENTPSYEMGALNKKPRSTKFEWEVTNDV